MHPLQFIRRATAALAVVAGLAAGAPAHANTLDTVGWLNGYLALDVHRSGGTQGVHAGGFTGTWHSGGTPDVLSPIVFWCFELSQNFNLGSSYPNYTPSTLGGGIGTQIAELYQEAFAVAGTSTINSVAFQLAVWELEYDTDLNVSTGAGFYATGGGANGAAARAQANNWLANLGSYTGSGWTITQLSHRERQDFIVGNLPPAQCCNQVPEPPVLPLVVTAMGAVALVQTRRRIRSRGD